MNLTLVGMPASGKSTVGVLLAKRLGYQFIDSDLLIQEQEGRLLKEIIAQEGLEAFMKIENQVNCGIDTDKAVIAPGGSVVYYEEAMNHFREIGHVVYLKLSFEEFEARIGNPTDRGVVLKPGMTLRDLYEERVPYYEKYADIVIDETGKTPGDVVDELREMAEQGKI
ncbi:shikimate kinase [Cuneatibacter caecimuris]|uniref:Shikimate kinase n=1 Tax=Cuneatibacter caecimuris TaxID=1796618 RepID=A0A4Q7P2H0_9FIRM|nr:shikimate kinase [Cuneatibacter caecimuris]RZS94093.1 shikimate kinase [Cuneatibacter caecimuris]